MKPTLSDVAEAIDGSRILGEANPLLERVTADTREDCLLGAFVAIRGFKQDGAQFIPLALQRGSVAVISEDEAALVQQPEDIGKLYVPDARLALAVASDLVYGHPSGELKLVGVTGTNGKTTVVTLTAAIFEAAGFPAATLGTLGVAVRGQVTSGERTTPEAPAIQRTLRSLIDQGIRGVAMEVASHGLVLQRTWGCAFDVGVFTNLTQDHLDFHGTMEEYYQAKRRLFVEYPAASSKPFTAVVNIDDPYGSRLAAELTGPVIRYGQSANADLRALDVDIRPNRVAYNAEYRGEQIAISAPIGARFNVYNSLAAVGAGLALGIAPAVISTALTTTTGVPGRFESVECGQPFSVIVDYAHTPDGLQNVLDSARMITSHRLSVVFGCGGDRDRTKRPLMGGIAAERADQLFVTSDNPRSEDPRSIIEEIVAGVPEVKRARTLLEPDRREAIRLALEAASPGDVVVIAGKGHENYQIFTDCTIHFDDREVVREILTGRFGKGQSGEGFSDEGSSNAGRSDGTASRGRISI